MQKGINMQTVPSAPLYDSDDETTDTAVISALASKQGLALACSKVFTVFCEVLISMSLPNPSCDTPTCHMCRMIIMM